MKKAIIHIPHSSAYIPKPYLPLFYLRGDALQRELLKMTDWYTDDLFADCGSCVTFPISRLVCDVERFRDPAMESMTKCGMWVCYEQTSDLLPLKKVTPSHQNEVLTTWYDPHHARLTEKVKQALSESTQALIVDAHSFSSVQLPYETVGGVRPDICIGTDAYHTPSSFTRTCAASFSSLGYSVAVNHPFCGCLVPTLFYQKDKSVLGIMIEVNRSLYMDEQTGQRNSNYQTVKRDLTNVIRQIVYTDNV